MSFQRISRTLHRWGAVIVAVPLLLVLGTGLLLLLKKLFAWIQPPAQRGASAPPSLSLDQVLEVAKMVPEAEVRSWDDIDRLDVRPGKGMLKVRARNRWEIQVDTATGEVLQVAYRRSDLIESIHDGTFFHDKAKLWLFLPSAIVLLGLWLTGLYLFILPYAARRKRRHRMKEARLAARETAACESPRLDPV
jgi:uncharacterized iron-regulated membrane protein